MGGFAQDGAESLPCALRSGRRNAGMRSARCGSSARMAPIYQMMNVAFGVKLAHFWAIIRDRWALLVVLGAPHRKTNASGARPFLDKTTFCPKAWVFLFRLIKFAAAFNSAAFNSAAFNSAPAGDSSATAHAANYQMMIVAI